MPKGLKLLLDAGSDPEFRVYAQNVIKEYFEKLTPEQIGEIAARMLLTDNPTKVTNRIDKAIWEIVRQRVQEVMPGQGYGQSKTVSALLSELVGKAITEIVEYHVNKEMIDRITREIVEKTVEKEVKSILNKLVRLS